MSWDSVSPDAASGESGTAGSTGNGGSGGNGTRGSAPVAADLRTVRLASYFMGVADRATAGERTPGSASGRTSGRTQDRTCLGPAPLPAAAAVGSTVTATVRNGALSDAQCSIAAALQAQVPYRVPFHAVSLLTLDAVALSPYELLRAFNGCVAALVVEGEERGTAEGGATAAPAGQAPPASSSPSPSLGQCVGLCIVRSVDVAAQCLLVLTPVPLADLRRVTTLVRPAAGSGISLPLAMSYHPDAATFPYLHCDSVQGASGAMKSRNNIQRH